MTTQTEQDSAPNVYTALAKAQADFPVIPMRGENPHYNSKFARLSEIRSAVTPKLTAEGLALTQRMEIRETGWVLITELVHGASDTRIASEYPLPNGGQPHVMGSALTYGRRYSEAAILNVVGEEDDDGNAAQDEATNAQKAEVDQMMPVEHPDQAAMDSWKEWGARQAEKIKQADSAMEIDGILIAEKDAYIDVETTAPKVYARLLEIVDKRKAELAEPAPHEMLGAG